MWKAQYNKAGRLWFLGVDVQENPGGFSRLAYQASPHDVVMSGISRAGSWHHVISYCGRCGIRDL